MNIITFSPALTLLYVFILLWILMGIELKSFGRMQRGLILFTVLFLCIANHILRELMDPAAYGKLLIVFMHLPTFLLFLYIAKRGVIKTAFMILTAVVFTAPTILINNLVSRVFFVGSSQALLLSNLISYALMLLLAHYVFRKGFNYLLIYGDTRFFLMLSLVPIAYYVYVLASINLNLSYLTTAAGYVVRFLPTIDVLLFYFLLPQIYKSLSERMLLQSAQDALRQKLDSTEAQIALLHESNMQMAVYRHDMRHQLILLDGLLSSKKIEQAQEFIKATVADLDALTPKQFCENNTINLLCCSYLSKAQHLGVNLKINARLPHTLPLSDTELCSIVSNGLENALSAASHPELPSKWAEFYCKIKRGKLLIQMKNPYIGQVTIRNGLPVAAQEGHGYGCHSIEATVQRNKGLCSFEAENGVFTLRLFIPLSN